MLELRPSCEHCQKALPPNATDAMICTYECTFCRDCVERVLNNVCPNCGGGFCERPVRPAVERVAGTGLGHSPAGTRVVHKPVDIKRQQELTATLADIPPHKR
ncbi:MAG: DUF1272 domain-containing protein [Gammaproteobacteria bacterium]